MKKSNSKGKAPSAFKKLGAVALITATLAMCFTACNQTGGGGGGKPTPTPTPAKYTVTLNQTEHGKVTASPEIPANKLVVKDTVITFTATANAGYKVGKWKVTPAEALQAGTGADGSPTAKVKITADTTVSVSFEAIPKHAITFSVEGANGTLKAKADGIDETSTSPINVEEGKTVTFTAEPSTNYKVKEWKVGDTVVTGNKTTTYTHTVTQAVTVKVSFEANSNPPTPTPTKHTVTLTQTANGKVTASPEIPEDKKVLKDTEITFTAKADDGYKIGKWTVTGSVLETGTGADGSSTAKVKITADTTVKVSFEAIPPTKYTVTLTQTEHGKVTASPKIPQDKQVLKDTEITFTAKADDGYKVDKWTVTPAEALQAGGADESESAKVKITADTQVSVSFIKKTYAVNFSVAGTGGTLKAEGDGITQPATSPIDVEHGKTVTFTATANDGYRVKGWTLDGSAVNGTAETYTLTITQAATVSVSFELSPVEGGAVLILNPNKHKIPVMVKTAYDSVIQVEGCTETTLASGVVRSLYANGTTVILKGNITELYCEGKNLTELNVQGLTSLQVLSCGGSENDKGSLTSLNVQGLTALKYLSCHTNKLTELNVQGLTSLQVLSCHHNQLTALNLQGLTSLQKLECYNNQLSELNLQGLTSLQSLDCYNNQLTELNLQGCASLQGLACSDNQLSELNLQDLTALRWLCCYGNQIKAQAMIKLLNALPIIESGYTAKAYLYTEQTGKTEGNCTYFSNPPELKDAFRYADGRKNWTLRKINRGGVEDYIIVR